MWNKDYLLSQQSEEGYSQKITLIPNFHKHLLLQTLQRMNINIMEVILQEELSVAQLAYLDKQTLIKQSNSTINLDAYGRAAKVI